jgi:tetratricopeptide (TPR) repeat protein
MIGGHFERAGDLAQAADYYIQAGQQARATLSPQAAIGYYQKALELLPPLPEALSQRLSSSEGLGEMLQWQARYDEAEKSYVEMRATAESLGDVAAQARAWIGIYTTQERRGNNREALESVRRAEELRCGGEAQTERWKRWLARVGRFPLWQRRSRSPEYRGSRCSVAWPATGEDGSLPHWLSAINDSMGRYQPAVGDWMDALALFRELGDRRGEWTLNNLGSGAAEQSDYAPAVSFTSKPCPSLKRLASATWR